jgi:hypothetical protein
MTFCGTTLIDSVQGRIVDRLSISISIPCNLDMLLCIKRYRTRNGRATLPRASKQQPMGCDDDGTRLNIGVVDCA